MAAIIDWVHAECEAWGRQIRWVYLGKDGWPSRTMLGKCIEEGLVGASATRMSQFFPECLNPDALRANRIIKSLPEAARLMLFVHYVVVGKGKVKAHRMAIPVRTYYDRLDQAHKAYSGASHQLHKTASDSATRNWGESVGFSVPLAQTA